MHKKFRHIETDATRAYYCHAAPDRLALQYDVQIAQHHGVIDAGDGRCARRDAGRQNHLVKACAQQICGLYPIAKT